MVRVRSGFAAVNRDDIDRRLKFLLEEVKQDIPILDQVVGLVIRQLGNWVSTEGDCSSRDLYERCRYRSRAAHKLALASPEDWYKNKREATNDQKVSNDHWEPVKQLHAWMCENKDRLTVDDIIARIARWPIVVMTMKEHRSLNHNEKPEIRYQGDQGIKEFFVRCDDEEWVKADPQTLMDGLAAA